MTAKSLLNPIERRWLDNFLIDQEPTRAARDAGYPISKAKAIGQELLRHPVMRQAIQEAMDERSARTLITADSVLHKIQAIVNRCMQAEPIVDKRTGKPVMIATDHGLLAPAYKFDAAGALKGLELLGKHLKLFADKLDINATVTHRTDVRENLRIMGLTEFKELAGITRGVRTEPPGRVIDAEGPKGVEPSRPDTEGL